MGTARQGVGSGGGVGPRMAGTQAHAHPAAGRPARPRRTSMEPLASCTVASRSRPRTSVGSSQRTAPTPRRPTTKLATAARVEGSSRAMAASWRGRKEAGRERRVRVRGSEHGEPRAARQAHLARACRRPARGASASCFLLQAHTSTASAFQARPARPPSPSQPAQRAPAAGWAPCSSRAWSAGAAASPPPHRSARRQRRRRAQAQTRSPPGPARSRRRRRRRRRLHGPPTRRLRGGRA